MRLGELNPRSRFIQSPCGRTGMQPNLAVKDPFWEEPIFHSGAIRVGDANVYANGSAGGIQKIYRAVVFPGARATREMWAALVRDGRCSRVARGGKVSRGVDRNDKGFPWLLAPTNFDKKRH